MVELPKTEAELQAYVDEKINAATTALKAEYDGKFATQRKKHDEELAKVKADAGKSAEEIAAQKLKEQQDADQQELTELRAYKKGKVIEERLGKEGLPAFLKNDSRLLNASDEDFDKVVKEVKKEYESVLPKGNQHSTVIQTNTTQPQPTEKDKANAEFGKALQGLIGK